MSGLKVGAGKCEISIPMEYCKAEGFATVHDPLHARAILINNEETLLLVSLEITSLPEHENDAIRQMIEEKTGIPRESIWVCAAHSFSSPHLLPDGLLKTEENRRGRDAYRTALQEAACKAATDALARLRPAVMKTNAGPCAIVANRDVELEDGWWVGTKGDGPTDPTVSVIRFELEPSHMEMPPRSARRQDEKDVVLISHFAMQSSVLDQYVLPDGGKVISSDVVGNACRKVEEAYGDGTVVMHLIGAAGDQAPIEKAVIETYNHGERSVLASHEDGFAICDRLSEKLSGTICELANAAGMEAPPHCVRRQDDSPMGIRCAKGESMEAPPHEVPMRVCSAKATVPARKRQHGGPLKPTREMCYELDGECETDIVAARLGDVALIGVKPELNCCTAAAIRAKSDFGMTLVCTMVNGASKYMADQDSCRRFTYEAMNSPFGPGAAEILSEKCVDVIRRLS